MADRFDDALAIAKQIQDKAGRLNALGDVAHFAPDGDAVFPDVIAALNAVRFRDIDLRIGSVAEALPHELRQPFLRAVLDWTARLSDSERERVFHDLAGPLAQAGLPEEALTCARAGRPQDQIEAMMIVATQAADIVRRDIVREAFGLAMMLPAGLSQATALAALLPVLDGDLRERAVTTIDVDALAAEIPASLARIVPLLLPQRTDDVLTIALAREQVLTALVAVTIDAPTDDLGRYWRAVTRAAGRLERAKALRMIGTIAPWTRRIGGEAALVGVVRSVLHIRRSWP
jgi:hypothetical protein